MSTTLPTFPFWFYIPAALLAALGLIGLYCSLFKGRHKGRLRCPKCWYDMKGATLPARCPECGTTAATLKDLQHTRRHWWHAIVALLLIVPLGVVFARLHAKKTYYLLMPKWTVVEEARYNDTTITRYRVRDPDAVFVSERVTLRSNGKTLIDQEDSSVRLSDQNRETLVDLNNDGVKEALIVCYTGGSHCCYRVYVVEFRPTGATIVADIDARNGLRILPPVAPGDSWLFDIPDQTFDYWKLPYAMSPRVSVYYRLQDGALRIALDPIATTAIGMKDDYVGNRSKAPSAADKRMQELLGPVFEHLYHGAESDAWRHIENHWIGDPADKASFIREMKDMLAKDPWYQDFLAARAAKAAGKPIPPSIIGMSGRAADAAR